MKAIINGKLVFPERIIEGNLLMEGDTILAAGKIAVPEGAEIIDAQGLFVGPGFIDQHSHGYQQHGENLPVCDDPMAAAAAHLKHGTTTYLASTDYSHPFALQEKTVELCVDALKNHPETSLAGIHLEGPFINRRFGSCASEAVEYSDVLCERIFSKAAPYALHCTYAPELPDAVRVEEKLRKYGIPGAIGHTCAGAEDIERAIACGAKIATHLFDAMSHPLGVEEAARRTRHPQDCTADILLAIPGLYYELICDSEGMHVTPHSVCQALRAAGEDHIILISDAVVEEAPQTGDRDVNFDIHGTLSGSRLCINRAVRNFVRFTGADVRVAFKCAATNAAKALGIFDKVGSIEAGKTANLVFTDSDLRVQRVFFRGEEVRDLRD